MKFQVRPLISLVYRILRGTLSVRVLGRVFLFYLVAILISLAIVYKLQSDPILVLSASIATPTDEPIWQVAAECVKSQLIVSDGGKGSVKDGNAIFAFDDGRAYMAHGNEVMQYTPKDGLTPANLKENALDNVAWVCFDEQSPTKIPFVDPLKYTKQTIITGHVWLIADPHS